VLSVVQGLWAKWQPTYISGFRNGECTDIVSLLRPDIIARVMLVKLAAREIAGGAGPYPTADWTATQWDANAAAAGMAVGAVPRAGSVMVMHSPNESTWAGHVLYVNAVNTDGSLAVTEEHAPVLWQVTQDTIPAWALSGRDIDFIY
jgi:hypothetical protein